jgi:hypothetical protein
MTLRNLGDVDPASGLWLVIAFVLIALAIWAVRRWRKS